MTDSGWKETEGERAEGQGTEGTGGAEGGGKRGQHPEWRNGGDGSRVRCSPVEGSPSA